jgi:hypothetical protein
MECNVTIYPEVGDSTCLRNIGTLLPDYIASHTKNQSSLFVIFIFYATTLTLFLLE